MNSLVAFTKEEVKFWFLYDFEMSTFYHLRELLKHLIAWNLQCREISFCFEGEMICWEGLLLIEFQFQILIKVAKQRLGSNLYNPWLPTKNDKCNGLYYNCFQPLSIVSWEFPTPLNPFSNNVFAPPIVGLFVGMFLYLQHNLQKFHQILMFLIQLNFKLLMSWCWWAWFQIGKSN